MKKELERIVGRDVLGAGYINVELLHQYTEPISSVLLAVRWSKVRYLHLIGKAKCLEGNLCPGTYVDVSGQWVLVVGVSAGGIQKRLIRCGASLEVLSILNTDITKLNVGNLSGLRDISLTGNIALSDIQGLGKMKQLEKLTVAQNRLSQIVFSEPLEKLRSLTISGNQNMEEVSILDDLPMLERLCIWESPVKKFHLATPLPKLDHIHVSNSPLGDACFLTMLPNVRIVQLERTSISSVPSMEGLARLESLFLESCPIATLDEVVFPDSLKMLLLSDTRLSRLPDSIARIQNLEYVDISKMKLESLPDWLPKLGLTMGRSSSHGINLKDTTVEGVDMSIFDQPQEMILKWFEERRKNNDVRLNEIKVVFLGDGEAGKSHTIARLMSGGGEPLDYTDQSTPGIVIKDKVYPMDGRNIRVHYWDFGGQEILHSMHRIFLTERTLYVVLVNARDETQDARARYWLHNIQSFAKDAPVILVLNKIDQNPKAKVNEPELRARYGNLRQVVSMSALKSDRETFNRVFTDVLLEEIRQTGFLDVKWPIPWTKVKGELENMSSNYIRGDEYQDICRQCSVDSNEKELLHWFNDLGVSYCCCDDYRLEDYMILRPDWITNALYIILFNNCPGAENGLIPHASIHDLLRKNPDNAAQIRRVLPNVFYNRWDEVSYVLEVFRKSLLSFDAGGGCEFIPMLCDPASSPVALEYERDRDTLEFRMEFEYLPNNLLHQLMVDRRVELRMDHVWRTGALFAQPETGFSAVVTIDGNILKIFVRHADNMHRPNTYLAMLKADVDRIWQKMGLKAPKNWLIYKVHGEQAKFSYERLLKMHARGRKEEYCDDLDREFPIEDILNQAAPAVEADEKGLLDAIILACQHLQGERRYWDWDENGRNTVVRDTLRGRGYLVNDQTLQGLSGRGTGSGELDLDIRTRPNTPWAICEALIVEGYSKKWNEHLDKLLNNYNPYGLRALYLLTYVDCEKEKFGDIWKKYRDHIRDDHPAGFELAAGSVETDLFTDYEYTKAARCRYRKGSDTPTVYHIFARIGK